MIAIIDYDAGNLRSVEKAFEYIGNEAVVTRDRDVLLKADKVVLPGVGSFGDAMEKLSKYNLTDTIKGIISNNTPFLGICLGLQLMFERSEETPGVEGLGIFKGSIVKFPQSINLKIPHIGWNSLDFPKEGRLFKGISQGDYVYFVHSFYLQAEDKNIVTATTEYGCHVEASVEQGNVFACQFHPEKSGETGLKILRNFASV